GTFMGTKGDVMKIGFIGLGRMGFALVSSLVKKDQTVFVYDINQSAMEKLAAAGAKPAASVADVCREADLVFTMLPGPKQVKEVALGDGGVVQSLKPGAVYIDMSTVDIETVDVVHAACEKAGIAFGDAPVGRLVAHGHRGESLIILGIDATHREPVAPGRYVMGGDVYD